MNFSNCCLESHHDLTVLTSYRLAIGVRCGASGCGPNRFGCGTSVKKYNRVGVCEGSKQSPLHTYTSVVSDIDQMLHCVLYGPDRIRRNLIQRRTRSGSLVYVLPLACTDSQRQVVSLDCEAFIHGGRKESTASSAVVEWRVNGVRPCPIIQTETVVLQLRDPDAPYSLEFTGMRTP